MTDSLAELSAALLDAARRAGAEAADAIAVRDASLSIDVRGGTLEQAERSEGVEIGLRVLLGRRQSCVSASDLTPRTMAEMAERAVAMAREAPEDPGAGLADPAQLAADTSAASLDLADDAAEPTPAQLEDMARAAEAAALGVQGVASTQGATASWGMRDIHLAATNGFSAGYRRTGSSMSCVAISGEGLKMEREFHGDSRTHAADLPDPAEIGRIAGERAAAMAGPRRAKTGSYPILFDERISSSLIGHLLTAINGTAIARGASWARGLMDAQVLPEALSLTEDPHRPRVAGSRPFDAEGLATHPSTIVENGILRSWTLDLATGRKLGLESTANAARGTSAPPSPSLTNVTLTQGDRTRDDLLRDMGTGLLVTSFIGATINPNTGDYSRGASGFWVEGGEIAYPVNEITIAGHLPDMLRRLVPANDAREHLSRRVPSLLVEGMTLAGD
ncbi:PmbA protein [Palleronia marisminoris]|uniref:Peptidase PmbA n=1 Tax=Palleronia marisminoris TaxID=315423 RepID=A0A1Y5SIJ7_9RHOB|nr:TldD/PmbA family protein [Palleronia marisminoris]SFG83330.1 PmbA protein [Palleronia marisminoris]SLN40945.1 peptidase PmbA [Palleronia marisminoris]